MNDQSGHSDYLRKSRRQDAIDRRLIFLASFIVFLAVATVARLLAWKWQPWPPGPNGYTTILNEAKTAANTITPYALGG